jgi:beta-glucosidase-like glycosyl hydrolase
MKALADTWTVPESAVNAIAAGCDGLLICSGAVELQAAACEALVHAVEDGRIPFARLEDALTRQRRAKERFLAAIVSENTSTSVLGCSEHQRIADEMRRFV